MHPTRVIISQNSRKVEVVESPGGVVLVEATRRLVRPVHSGTCENLLKKVDRLDFVLRDEILWHRHRTQPNHVITGYVDGAA